jgi:hypothetical protein
MGIEKINGLYLSYNDFIKNYDNDFKEWQKEFPNGDETIYLSHLRLQYMDFPFFDKDLYDKEKIVVISSVIKSFAIPEGVHFSKATMILQTFFDLYFSHRKEKCTKEKLRCFFEKEENLRDVFDYLHNEYSLTDDSLEIENILISFVRDLRPFIEIEELTKEDFEKENEGMGEYSEVWKDEWGESLFYVHISEKKYTDFHHTLLRIFSFIDERARQITEELHEPPLDLSDTSIKTRLAMLDELGVLDYIRGRQPLGMSTNKLATLLSAILGIESTTLQSYLNAMRNKNTDQKNAPSDKHYEEARLKLINLKVH